MQGGSEINRKVISQILLLFLISIILLPQLVSAGDSVIIFHDDFDDDKLVDWSYGGTSVTEESGYAVLDPNYDNWAYIEHISSYRPTQLSIEYEIKNEWYSGQYTNDKYGYFYIIDNENPTNTMIIYYLLNGTLFIDGNDAYGFNKQYYIDYDSTFDDNPTTLKFVENTASNFDIILEGNLELTIDFDWSSYPSTYGFVAYKVKTSVDFFYYNELAFEYPDEMTVTTDKSEYDIGEKITAEVTLGEGFVFNSEVTFQIKGDYESGIKTKYVGYSKKVNATFIVEEEYDELYIEAVFPENSITTNSEIFEVKDDDDDDDDDYGDDIRVSKIRELVNEYNIIVSMFSVGLGALAIMYSEGYDWRERLYSRLGMLGLATIMIGILIILHSGGYI